MADALCTILLECRTGPATIRVTCEAASRTFLSKYAAKPMGSQGSLGHGAETFLGLVRDNKLTDATATRPMLLKYSSPWKERSGSST
jgi:hypothetical protein